MTDIIPNFKELKNAAQEIKLHIKNSEINRYIAMDLFYGVECGLKALLIRNNKPFKESYKTHNINKLAAECNFPLKIPNIINVNDSLTCIPIDKIHTVLRYGVKIKACELEKFKNKISAAHDDILIELARK